MWDPSESLGPPLVEQPQAAAQPLHATPSQARKSWIADSDTGLEAEQMQF